jgi:hypothetical protein
MCRGEIHGEVVMRGSSSDPRSELKADHHLLEVCDAYHRTWGPQAMTTPKIQALGITQEGAATRWNSTGYVTGVGWLEAWGTSLIAAMEELQALAAQQIAPQGEEPSH